LFVEMKGQYDHEHQSTTFSPDSRSGGRNNIFAELVLERVGAGGFFLLDRLEE